MSRRGEANGESSLADVYISYAPADRKRGQEFARALEAEGFSVDQAAAGAAKLTRPAALAECAAALVLWSKASVRHDAVTIDAAQAFNQNKLVPLLLQEVEPPYPYSLAPSLDLSAWRGERDEPLWRETVAAVKAAMGGRPPTPRAKETAAAPPAPPPPEPPPAWRQTPNIFAAPPPRPPPPEPVAEAPRAQPAPARPAPPEAAEEPHVFVDDKGPGKLPLAPIILGAVALGAAALWAGPRLYESLHKAPESIAEAPAPPEFATVPAMEELTVEDEPDQGAPETVALAPDGPPPVVEAPSRAAPPLDAPAAPAKAQPDSTMAGLETCMAQLAKQCGPLDPPIAGGFKADGRLSPGEMRLLSAPLFPDRSLVTAANLNACLGAKSPAALGRACPSIAAKINAPPVVSVRPNIPEPIKAPEKPAPVAVKPPGPALEAAKPEAKPAAKPAAKPVEPKPAEPKPAEAKPEPAPAIAQPEL